MATQRLASGLTIACSCLFIPSSALLTGLRFHTRRRQNATLGVDDWLIVPAFVSLQKSMVYAEASLTIHTGTRYWDADNDDRCGVYH